MCFLANILGQHHNFDIAEENGSLFPRVRDVEKLKQNSQIRGSENLMFSKFSDWIITVLDNEDKMHMFIVPVKLHLKKSRLVIVYKLY